MPGTRSPGRKCLAPHHAIPRSSRFNNDRIKFSLENVPEHFVENIFQLVSSNAFIFYIFFKFKQSVHSSMHQGVRLHLVIIRNNTN